jgi:hypothetical protein
VAVAVAAVDEVAGRVIKFRRAKAKALKTARVHCRSAIEWLRNVSTFDDCAAACGAQQGFHPIYALIDAPKPPM